MIGAIIFLSIVIVFLILALIICWNNSRTYYKKLSKFESLYDSINVLSNHKNILQKEIDAAEILLSTKRDEICRTSNSFTAIQTIQQTKLAELLQSLNDEIAAKRLEEININKMVKTKQQELTDIQSAAVSIEQILFNNKAELNALSIELNSIRQQHKEATLRLNDLDLGRVLEHKDEDIQLTQTLEVLKLQYPFLADAFAAIEWSKIWQTKFQTMTNDLLKLDKCGIYRIFTIENGIQKSYIGQAKRIRERWSQHIKKMLGVERADNSKLYNNVKPWTAHFEIIEECAEAQLNVKEHYWISYYNGVEDGYNIRT